MMRVERTKNILEHSALITSSFHEDRNHCLVYELQEILSLLFQLEFFQIFSFSKNLLPSDSKQICTSVGNAVRQ